MPCETSVNLEAFHKGFECGSRFWRLRCNPRPVRLKANTNTVPRLLESRNVTQSKIPDETTSLVIPASTYRCTCGNDVALRGGEGLCDRCQRRIAIGSLTASQTVSFTSPDSGAPSVRSLLTSSIDRSDERLGHFRLISILGQGGMGVVYRALDESLQRYVAVKVMRNSGTEGSSAQRVTRLLDEAVAQARLNHPHVVTIYYVGRDNEDPFFAMELLPGPTLDKVLANGPLPYSQVVRFARQVVSALSEATKLNLVHGDIKPSNLIMANNETVKLGDFGLARIDQKQSIGISGTLNYMAPELADGAAPSPQSDMYALGVTLFELTFGHRPFQLTGATISDQLNSQRMAIPQFPEKWPAGIPFRWRSVLQRLLMREPTERFQNYEHLEQALRSIAPVGVTKAGRLHRLLAFAIDQTMQLAIIAPLVAASMISILPLDSITNTTGRFFARNGFAMLSLLTLVVPLAMAWLEWKGVRTPGRYLFQLRVVDEHGLRLTARKRLIRGLCRNGYIWTNTIATCLFVFGLTGAFDVLSFFDEAILVINGLAVLGPKRLAIHDRLVGSHVVLDTVAPANLGYH